MKRKLYFLLILSLVLGITLLVSTTFVFAEETEYKKYKIVVLKTKPVNSAWAEFAKQLDVAIMDAFIELGRFEVKSYNYAVDVAEAEDFINFLKKKLAEKQEGKYQDIFISLEDIQDLMKSYVLVFPALKEFYVKAGEMKTKEGEKTVYTGKVSVSFKLYDPETEQFFETFTISEKVEKDTVSEVESALISSVERDLQYSLRQIDKFKLKAKIAEISGRKIVLGEGKNIGIKLGYEFDAYKVKTITVGNKEKKLREKIGVVRVSKVEEDLSEGVLILGTINENAELIEGVRHNTWISLELGYKPLRNDQGIVYFRVEDYSPAPDVREVEIKWNKTSFAPVINLNGQGWTGFNDFAKISLEAYINNPLSTSLGLNVGKELFIAVGHSIDISLNVEFIGIYSSLGTMKLETGYAEFPKDLSKTEYVKFYNDMNLYLYGFTVGIGPAVQYNLFFSENLCLTVQLGARYAPLPYYYIRVEGTGDESDKSAVIDLSDTEKVKTTVPYINFTGGYLAIGIRGRF